MEMKLKHRLVFDALTNKVILFLENTDGETSFEDVNLRAYESNNLVDIYDFIAKNNLSYTEIKEFNPFESGWDNKYPIANLRLFMKSFDCNRLAIDKPEFVMYMKQQNINLLPDANYGGVWAYLEYILPEHREFLEKKYNAKFEQRL